MRLSGVGKYEKRGVVFGGLIGITVFGFLGVFFCGLPSIGTVSADSAVPVSVSAATVLSLTTTPSGSVSIPITPTAVGATTTKSLVLDVSTNNLTGYTLTMNGNSSNTNLVHTTDSSSTLTPPTSSSLASPKALAANNWGYAIPKTQTNPTGILPNNTNNFSTTYSIVTNTATSSYTNTFAPIPVLASPLTLKATTANATSDKTDLIFGASANQMKRSGSYTNTVVFTVVGNYVEPGFPTNSMQAFTKARCNAMSVDDTIVLLDARGDERNYRVRKLADGKCWMIDNLKLGNTGNDLVLTPNDSNVEEDFILPANAVTTTANRATNGRCDSGAITGTGGYLTCAGTTSGTSPANNFNFVAYVDPSSTEACYENSSPSGDGTRLYAPESLGGCGYYYNWYTATAGKGTYDTPADTSTNANAVTSSICPVGWRLPKAQFNVASLSNEFAVLNGAMLDGNGPSITNSLATAKNFDITGSFSGSYSSDWGTTFHTENQGIFGFFWSASATTNPANATHLAISRTGVNAGTVSNTKYLGRSVRCVLD